jgi:hypothetical protein
VVKYMARTQTARIGITDEEMFAALVKLAHNKAVGVDGASDQVFHTIRKTAKAEGLHTLSWLTRKTEELVNNPHWPEWFGCARVIPLSKDGSNYPDVNNTRTIAVLPTYTKLVELIIL